MWKGSKQLLGRNTNLFKAMRVQAIECDFL